MVEQTEWHTRDEAPPAGVRVWVSDGTDIWMLTGDGKPFPERARACKFWMVANLPKLPNGETPRDITD